MMRALLIFFLFITSPAVAQLNPSSQWYWVAVMQGKYAGGYQDIYIHRQEFKSINTCKNHVATNANQVMKTLVYVFGAERKTEKIICSEHKNISDFLKKRNIHFGIPEDKWSVLK